MAEHTPTPWEVDSEEIYGGKSTEGQYERWELICRIPTECNKDGLLTEEQKANAQFIVRACNAHEELLYSCKCLLDWINNIAKAMPYESLIDQMPNNFSRGMAIEAIAKAEGKE